MASTDPHMPSARTTKLAKEALEALEALPPKRGPRVIRVRRDGGKPVELTIPREAFELFVAGLGEIAQGKAPRIVSVEQELTTQQAAELLNVSRPWVVQLIEEGKIPYHLVGTHRRIRAKDLLTYKAKRDAERETLLDELSAEAQRLGIY